MTTQSQLVEEEEEEEEVVVVVVVVINPENSHIGHCIHSSESTYVKVQ